MDQKTSDTIEANIKAGMDVATAIAAFFPGGGITVAIVIKLITEVGWPMTRYLIHRLNSTDTLWTEADMARVDRIVSTVIGDYEAGIVPLPAGATAVAAPVTGFVTAGG